MQDTQNFDAVLLNLVNKYVIRVNYYFPCTFYPFTLFVGIRML